MPERFLTETIVANTAGDNSKIAQQRSDVCEIGGSAAQLFATGKKIPEKFAEADDDGARGGRWIWHIQRRSAKGVVNRSMAALRTPCTDGIAWATGERGLLVAKATGYGFGFSRDCNCSANFNSRSASSAWPRSRYAWPSKWCGMPLLGSMEMARCKARMASCVSPFFWSTLPRRMYGPVEVASSQMERWRSFSASSNL